MDRKFISGVCVGGSAVLSGLAIAQGHLAVAAIAAVGIVSGSILLLIRLR